jgi:tRNA(adenine34) deaminase
MPIEIDSEAAAKLMTRAILEAKQAASLGEVPAGAVVAEADGAILATGHNRVIGLSDPTAHAEILALRKAAELKGSYRLLGLILVSTIEPCPMCLMAAIHARVERIFYGAKEPKWGAAVSRLNLHQQPWLNHHPLVQGGLMSDECASLMINFFQAKRQKV